MNLNWSLFSGRSGMLRLVTLIIGVIDLGVTADQYFKNSGKEEFFLAMVIIMFIISLIWCILFSLEIIASTDALKKGDMAYHVIGGLLLLISAIVWMVHIFDLWDFCHALNTYFRCYNILRLLAGILGIINGIVYIWLGVTLYQAPA